MRSSSRATPSSPLKVETSRSNSPSSSRSAQSTPPTAFPASSEKRTTSRHGGVDAGDATGSVCSSSFLAGSETASTATRDADGATATAGDTGAMRVSGAAGADDTGAVSLTAACAGSSPLKAAMPNTVIATAPTAADKTTPSFIARTPFKMASAPDAASRAAFHFVSECEASALSPPASTAHQVERSPACRASIRRRNSSSPRLSRERTVAAGTPCRRAISADERSLK